MRDTKPEQSLEGIFTRIGYTALIAAVVVEFGAPLLLLAAQASSVPSGMWWTLAAPLLVMAVALPFTSARQRIVLANALGLALLLVQVAIDQPYGPAWFPYTFAVFAVGFGAAFSLRTLPALAVIASAAVLNFLAVMRPTRQLVLEASDLAGGTAGPALAILVCGGFAMVAQGWRRTARASDERTRGIERATADAYRAEQVQSARTAIERRIHETILNTLNVVTRGRQLDREVLSSECRRDLEQLSMGMAVPAPDTVSGIVDEASALVPLAPVAVRATVRSDARLPQQTASAVRDALVEILRNVARHSGATRCTIDARAVDGTVRLEVADDGVGLTQDARERFGLRNSIRGSVAAVGGTTSLTQGAERGLTVRIDVPITEAVELQVPAEPALHVLLRPLSSRLLLLGGAVFGLLLMPWLTAPFGDESPRFVVAWAAFIAANVALALAWHRPRRMLAALAVIVTTFGLYLALQASATTCEVAPSIHWTINSAASCLSLLLFVSSGRAWNWLVIPAVTGTGLWIMVTLPDECRSMVVMPLVSTTTYLAAAMVLISVILKAADRQRRHALELWSQATARRAEVARQVEAAEQWSRVSSGTRELLTGLADGKLDPDDPSVRRRAAREESQLRASLDSARRSSSSIWQDLARVMDHAASVGTLVDVDVIEVPRDDRHLPETAVRVLNDVVLATDGDQVTLRLIVIGGTPEVVCTCPQGIAEAAWQAHVGLLAVDAAEARTELDDGTVMSLERMEDGLACLSVRQEA